MLTKEGLLCETSEATLAMLHKMFVSEKQWKMNMVLQQWREALCCKLESKGDWRITSLSLPACQIWVLWSHISPISHTDCVLFSIKVTLSCCHMPTAAPTSVTFCFYPWLGCLGSWVCVHPLRSLSKSAFYMNLNLKQLKQYLVKIYGNTWNRNLDRLWLPRHNFPQVH